MRLQLEEVSRERDFLQNQNKATVEKVQNAMDEMSHRLEESQSQNNSLLEEVNAWRESGEFFTNMLNLCAWKANGLQEMKCCNQFSLVVAGNSRF